ncbi:hypothetical protein [Streptomyces goshikiensis]|uniref:hypothetical protein n=1 Tax=Streptomyces goshikiensis TaxID=1942 RepID=UPI00367F586A
MVCRENKGRSAVIGYQKHLLKQLGYRDYDDFELQSGVHEFGHQYEGFPRPTEKEQLQFLQGLRHQIEADPRITAADKYRESDRQPGMVTRIDQEIARLKTGKDEHGKPLQPKHRMRGQDLAAMQRLGVLLQRNQEAKDSYFDVYARTMGMDAKTARARWKDLVRRQKSERENTNISLTDLWRDNLAVSGFTSRHQADIGQSNVSREALRIMEEERRQKLASLPTRPALTSAQRVRMAEPGASVQCTGPGACGQFGHEASACPNQTCVKERDDARARWKEIDAKIRKETDRADEHARKAWAFIPSYSHQEMRELREERERHLQHDQQVTNALASSSPRGVVRCTVCQQFGHEQADCPNPARVDELNDLRGQVDQFYDQMEARGDWISAAEDEVPADDPELQTWRTEYGHYEFLAQQASGQYKDKRAEIATQSIRCEGGCGQFGHTREECPNGALLDEVDTLAKEAERIREQVRRRAELRGQNPDTTPLTDADHAAYDAWFQKSVDIDKRLIDAGIDPERVSTASALAKSKPTGPVSVRIQEVGYNPDTGYLEVTARPYTRKRDGKVMPAKTYAYRMSPSEHQRMMAASSLTSYVSQSVWARNGGAAAYQFENTAEAAEASVQRKCATCGRWASMTSAHTCPVSGSRAGQDDSARRARIKAEKAVARATGRPVQMPPQVESVSFGAALRFGNNGSMNYAERARIDAALSAGKVAQAEVRAAFLDANVSGQAIAWNNADGQAQLSTDREDGATLKCTCRTFKQNGRCKHVQLVGAAMASRYAADHPAVGSPLRSTPVPAAPVRDETARDAPEDGFTRMPYSEIRQRRGDLRGKEREAARASSAAGDGRWLRAAGPIDGVTGKRVKTPVAWTDRAVSADPAAVTASGAVRLERSKDVQEGLRVGLRAQTGKHWSVTRKPDGWLHITTSLQRRTAGRTITAPERAELAKALQMPVQSISEHGVAVPPDNGWRAEFMDRAHGKAPRVLGERFVARADQRREVLLNI